MCSVAAHASASPSEKVEEADPAPVVHARSDCDKCAALQGYCRIDPELVLPTVRSHVEAQLLLIAEARFTSVSLYLTMRCTSSLTVHSPCTSRLTCRGTRASRR